MFLVWYGYLEDGFERRLLASVRWTLATAVAFPQKSESILLMQFLCNGIGYAIIDTKVVFAVKKKLRAVYTVLFFSVLLAEIFIALFVHDKFIRPYFGDVLITVLLCCFVRMFIPTKLRWLPVYVFLFAVVVEIGQYFNYVELLGLGDIQFFRTWMGTSFSFYDMICYGVGCVVFFAIERYLSR